jgi:hypothetical protein
MLNAVACHKAEPPFHNPSSGITAIASHTSYLTHLAHQKILQHIIIAKKTEEEEGINTALKKF